MPTPDLPTIAAAIQTLLTLLPAKWLVGVGALLAGVGVYRWRVPPKAP
jgi:hypothetical protein